MLPRRARPARWNRTTRRTRRSRCRTRHPGRRHLQRLHQAGRKVALIHYSPLPAVHAEVALPATPEGYAHALYAALRAMDGTGADLILVEAPPQDGAWLGVNDRLRRAAHGSAGIVHV
jgi:L-threonylcarbamoyladenylate synthase